MNLAMKITRKIYSQKIDNEKEYETLFKLVQNNDGKLAAFAMRKDIPKKYQEKLLECSEFVKEILAKNNSINKEILEKLKNDKDVWVSKAAVKTLESISQ